LPARLLPTILHTPSASAPTLVDIALIYLRNYSLVNMGNDGGSIPKRRELVKEAAKNPTSSQLRETILEKQEFLWTTDPLSNQPLRAPIVSDCNGKLYNKDAILEYLLPSDDPGAPLKKAEAEKLLDGAVKSLKDVVEVKFETDPATKDSGKWVCPITQKVLGSGTKAAYLVPCGHAFSEVALKVVADGKCLQCNETYAPNDVISILSVSETEIERLILRVKELKEKGLTHSLKKASGSKKKKKNGAGDDKVPELVKPDINEAKTPSTGIKNTSTASLTAKVLEEQEKNSKKRKNDNLASLFSSGDRSKQARKNDFFTRGFTMPTNGQG